MKNQVINALQSTENYKNLVTLTKNVQTDVKNAKTLFWYVNNLNRLYRKNEFVNNTNIREFGKKLYDFCIEHGIEVSKDAPFNMYVFTKVNGISCYKYSTRKKSSGYFAIDVEICVWKEVKKSESSLIAAYKYIMGADEKKKDRIARDNNKIINAEIRKENAKLRKELRKEQEQARELYNSGIISIEKFAEIMKKAI